MIKLKVSSWNDGKHNPTGSGYGIRVGNEARKYFRRDTNTIRLSIENSAFFEVNITGGFWNKCPEFRDKRIGEWMIKNGFAPWEKGKPTRFNLFVTGENEFLLERI